MPKDHRGNEVGDNHRPRPTILAPGWQNEPTGESESHVGQMMADLVKKHVYDSAFNDMVDPEKNDYV